MKTSHESLAFQGDCFGLTLFILFLNPSMKTNYKLCYFQRFPILKRDAVVNVSESPEHLEMKKLYALDVGVMV